MKNSMSYIVEQARKSIDAGRRVEPAPDAPSLTDRMLKVSEVAERLGVTTRQVYRLAQSDPAFPRLVKLTDRATRIFDRELCAWQQSLGRAEKNQPSNN